MDYYHIIPRIFYFKIELKLFKMKFSNSIPILLLHFYVKEPFNYIC